jgi:hypothetical protein
MQLADGIAGTKDRLAFLVDDVAGPLCKLVQGLWRDVGEKRQLAERLPEIARNLR